LVSATRLTLGRRVGVEEHRYAVRFGCAAEAL
jgi:hypothetical protein